MNEYTMGQLARDRRRDLEHEAAEARLASVARGRRSRATFPATERRLRARIGLILGRSAA